MALSEITWRRIIREELAAIARVPVVVPRLPPDVTTIAPPKIKLVEIAGKLADAQIDISPTLFSITAATMPVDAQIENDLSISVSVETKVE
jgi:hypothetical protein